MRDTRSQIITKKKGNKLITLSIQESTSQTKIQKSTSRSNIVIENSEKKEIKNTIDYRSYDGK